jgi:hypothetical protein
MSKYHSFKLAVPSAFDGVASVSVLFSSLSMLFALVFLGLMRWLKGFDLGQNDFAGLPILLLQVAVFSLLATTGLTGSLLGIAGLFRAGHRLRAAVGVLEAILAALIFSLTVWCL